jgi:hypothetical protein
MDYSTLKLESKQTFPLQAQVFLAADDDMVHDIYTHNFPDFSQSSG